MKNLIYLAAILTFAVTHSQSTKRISLHLFDLPKGITIEEFQKDLDKANNICEKNEFVGV
jgi:hypothetical protein|tara:strand:+ start:1267 stop:1446 length:180 start_codon:yes stop_codon:yes gene_type:complete